MKKSAAKKSTSKKTASKRSANENVGRDEVRASLEEMMRMMAAQLGGGIVVGSDLDAMMTSFESPSPTNDLSEEEYDARYKAQDLAFAAMEARTNAEARRLAKKALKLDPDCVDALVTLNDLDTHTTKDFIAGLEKAIAAGERSLGAKFIRENEGMFWQLIETRPYMRALAQLGAQMASAGMSMDAIRVCERMLELNPNDNQGVRDSLLGLYLAMADVAGAGKLLKQYKDDATANASWGRTLERWMSGDRTKAKAELRKAMKANRFVAPFLTGEKAVPKQLPEMYSLGSVEEAMLCANNLGAAWAAQTEARVWLREQTEKA